MPDAANTRLAVLIDADNTSATQAGALLDELARYGVPTVKRAYGDWTTQQLVSWKKELPRHAIQPIQQFANTTGKNSTDSALIIDAMDLLYSGNLDAFAIVSSDSDFTRLATRLRESGKTVYGLGRRRTPEALVAACNKFIFLDVLDKEGAEDPRSTGDDSADDESVAELPDLRRLLTTAINSTSQEDGWANLGSVGSFLSTSTASFDPRHYGFAKLVNLARAQDYLDVEHAGGNAPQVRLKSGRPAKKAAAKKTARKR